jgi:hypothetical protein
VIGADETTWRLMGPHGKPEGGSKRCYVWGAAPNAVYDKILGNRSAEAAETALGAIEESCSRIKNRAAVQIEHRAALLILAAVAALFTGPLFPVSPDPFRRWALAQWSYALLYLILTVLQWKALWSSSSRISPSPVRSSRAH